MEHTAVYITADCVISSLGFSTDENWNKMLNYDSGINLINNPLLYVEPFLAAQISDSKLQNYVSKKKLYRFTRLEQLFILSIEKTIFTGKIDVTESNCGLIISSTKGNIGLLSAEKETDTKLYLTDFAERIAAYFGFTTKPIVVCNACISGVSALITGKRLIQNGTYKNIIVAGGDELTHFVTAGFHAFKSISRNICKPYDAARDGLSLGEACGSLLLTSDATMVAEPEPICLLGGAISNDSNHISGPSRTGQELSAAMFNAMTEANLQATDISFVNTHGTATIYNDEMESKALHLIGLTETPTQSLKPFLGHTLGASGIIETIFCKKQIEQNRMLGIPNYEANGVPFPLCISSKHKQMELTTCLKTASGFGGCNAAIVIGTASKANPEFIHNTFETQVVSHCKTDKTGIYVDNKTEISNESADNFATFIRKAYTFLDLDYRKFYKMDDLSKLGFITTAFLLRSADDFSQIQPESKGIVVANKSASLHTDVNFRRNMDSVGDYEVSPAIFVYTLPNVMLGEICIRWKIKGENTFFIQEKPDFYFLMHYARLAMQAQNLQTCIVGWCDLLTEDFEAEFFLVEKVK